MQKSKNCNQGTLFKTCMHFSREIKEVKDACILSLQFSKITKPITTSLVKNEYENKCTGSLISLLSSSEKFQNYCVSSQTKQTIWRFFSHPLKLLHIYTELSSNALSCVGGFLMYSLQISLSKIESLDHKEF